MNIRHIHIFRTFAAMLLCAAAVSSCSQDEIDAPNGNIFSPDKYPLSFTASVGQMSSRADETEPDSWVDDDIIRVRIYPICKDENGKFVKDENGKLIPDDSYRALGQYKLNADGSVKESIDPIAWPDTAGFVKAWYPFFDDKTTIKSSIQDQSKGYHDINFLYVETDTMHFKTTANLVFKHKMAKVRCVLKKGDGITDADFETIKLTYRGYTSVSFSENVFTPEGDDWITPYSYSYSGENSASVFEALLAPRDMTEEEFIKVNLTVTVNGIEIPKTLVYKPDDLNLEAGSLYTFNITVQKDRLEIKGEEGQGGISGAWKAPDESKDFTEPESDKYHINIDMTNLPKNIKDLGELTYSSNVTEETADTGAGSGRCLEVLGNEFTISYKVTIDNCHLGLVFANKNTLNHVSRIYYEKESEGYYEFTYTIGEPIGEPVSLEVGKHIEVGDILFLDGSWGGIPEKYYKYEEEPGKYKYIKTPVGIVFRVGAGGDSQHNTLDQPSNYGWNDNREIRGYAVALEDASTGRLAWGPLITLDAIVSSWSAIKYSGIIATNNAKKKGINNYPAFKAVIEYPSPVPEGSSGWYLPSYRQLTDIRNLFTHPQRRELITKAGGEFFQTKYPYCTATERSASNIWPQGFVYTENYDPSSTARKTYTYFVRGVLTF